LAKTKKRVVGEGIGVEIFKNRLVPKSQILNEQETQALLEKYNLSKQQLPRILAADPVARTLKAKGGDVIEFDRTNRSAGLSKYYRVVIGGA
jgi:DNA-directed RNA polymerase I, II, and III subunit RPABC1